MRQDDEPTDDRDAPPLLLDLRGSKCPLPVLRTRKALRRLGPGQSIAVICTDPLAGIDIPNLVRESGDRLVGISRAGDEMRFLIRRTARAAGSAEAAWPSAEDPMRQAGVDRGDNKKATES